MVGDGKPKPLNLPRAGDTPSPSASPCPKPLNLGSAPEPEKKPRALQIAEAPPPATTSSPTSGIPRALGIQNIPDPAPTPKTLVEQLVEKAQQIEPAVRTERIKGRIDTILSSTVSGLLDFGNRNLAPLQDASNREARIASEMARIDPVGWIERTKDASCKTPSFFDRLSAKPPSYYEGMLKNTRVELMAFVTELDQMKKDFVREVTDLHLDAIAMIVCSSALADDQARVTADNRGRTLLQAHQTAAILQATIEQSLALCAQSIQQIDHLMTVILPNWKIAVQK